MNYPNSELILESLVARISQLEMEQDLRGKNIAWLKHYFDEFKQLFNNRTELQEIEIIQQNIAEINAQLAELQQPLNHPLMRANLTNVNLRNTNLLETNF
jgi:uncharacterized protein YjbI with pentapeptide repeats